MIGLGCIEPGSPPRSATKCLAFEHHEHHHHQAVEEEVEEEGGAVAVERIEDSREDFTRAKRTRPGRKITRKSERKA